jgi:translocation and assembly module TamB
VLGAIGAIAGTTVTFVAATAAAAVIHLDVPAARRLVAAQVTNVLHGRLRGDVTIEHIGGLGVRGVDGVRARVKDPEGVQVLFVDGVRVRVRGLAAARSALFGEGAIAIVVDEVKVNHVEGSLDADAQGKLRIANAFLPKEAPGPETKVEEPTKGRGVKIEAPHVALRHAWAHGAPPGAPAIDAEIANLVGAARVDPEGVRADLARADLVARAAPGGANPVGTLFANVEIPFAQGAPLVARAGLDGTIGGIPAQAEGAMHGKRVDARLDVRSATGERLRSMLGEVPLHDTVDVHAEAHGELPSVDGKLHATLGDGTADVDAHVEAGATTNIRATVRVRRIDLRSLAPGAPPSSLGLDAAGRVALGPKGRVDAALGLETLPGRIGDDVVPRVEVVAAYAGARGHAKARLLDPQMPTSVDVEIDGTGGSSVVDAHVVSNVPDLTKIPRTNGVAKGSATLEANARLDLGAKTIAGRAALHGAGVAYRDGAVRDVSVLAVARGTIDRPTIDVGVHAGDVRFARRHAESLDVRASVAPPAGGAPLEVRDAHVDLVDRGRSVGVTATRVEVGRQRMIVEGGVVDGLGEPIRASVRKDARELHVVVVAPRVDLERVAFLAGKERAVRRGRLAIAGDVALTKDAAAGEVHARVEDVAAGSVEDARATLEATFRDKEVSLALDGVLGDAGRVQLRTRKVKIGGSPVDAAAWRTVTGRARIDAEVDLAKVVSLIPDTTLPVGELRGEATVRAIVGRPNVDQSPEFRLTAYTRGLVVAGKTAPEAPTGGVEVKGVAPWRSDDVDVHVDAYVDAPTGEGEVALQAYDRHGTVMSFDLKSTLPYTALLAARGGAKPNLDEVPFAARILVPRRELDRLPRVVGLKGFAGTFDADVEAHGTPVDPRVTVIAHARRVRGIATPLDAAADTDVTLGYDGATANVAAKMRMRGQEVLDAGAKLAVSARDLVAHRPGAPLDWEASARVKLAAFPLQTFGRVADRRVRGRASGEVTLDGLHRDAVLHGKVVFDALQIGRAKYEHAVVDVSAADGALAASARFDQTDGFADVKATAGLVWGAKIAPSLDPERAVEARVDAKAFRVAAVAPFVRGVVDDVDGRVDGKASITLGPGPEDARMEGRLALRDGRVEVSALGQQLRDVRAKIALDPGGLVKVDDVVARGTDGELHASAEVHLKGLSLSSADASLEIAKNDAFDLALQGQPIGQMYGRAHLTARAAENEAMKVAVEIPRLHVRLPQVLKTGIQALGRKENIRVGVVRDGKTFVMLPLDRDDAKKEEAEPEEGGAPTAFDVKLGEITVVRGNQVRVVAGGDLHAEVGAETNLTGQIALKEGDLVVQGKKFKIEHGTVTFQSGDPSNPIVVATAAWDAADGTKIYADFVGPVKTGKVNLRSEPPRPKNEILAMILFGTADGMNGQAPASGRGTDGTTKAAVGIGGGFAAQGLSEALDDLAGIQAQARVDTTEANNPRPELEVQVARNLSVAFAHVLGNPPISEPDKNLVRTNLRFHRNWSLETLIGDRGRGEVDAVWQKRY